MGKRIKECFFSQDALEIAPKMIGAYLVRKFDDGTIFRSMITEVEVYRGGDDLACHASKGKTERTKIMFEEGGRVYVYLIYGMYWLINITTGKKDEPQAILIRGTEAVSGPGRIGRELKLDSSFYGENIYNSDRIWIEIGKNQQAENIITTPRIGVDYAGEYWANINWRWILKK